MIITVVVAVPLGVLAAYKHGSWIDRLVMAFSVIGFSVPVFVLGYLLIYVCSRSRSSCSRSRAIAASSTASGRSCTG